MAKFNHYTSNGAMVYPSSAAANNDRGKLTLEQNLAESNTRITLRNYVLDKTYFSRLRSAPPLEGVNPDDYFKLSVNSEDESKIDIAEGQASVMGYHVIAKKSITIDHPDNAGEFKIGLKLEFDMTTNNVLGVVEGEDLFGGCNISWYPMDVDDIDILILGSAKWDPSTGTYEYVKDNPNKMYVIDAGTIYLTDGVSLKLMIEDLPNTYVQKKGDSMFGSLVMARPKLKDNPLGPEPLTQYEADPDKIGVIIQTKDDVSSSITVKPPVGATSALTAVLSASTASPFLQLGKAMIRGTSSELTVSGLPLTINEGGTSKNPFKVISPSSEGIIELNSNSSPFINMLSQDGNSKLYMESNNDASNILLGSDSFSGGFLIQHLTTTGQTLMSGGALQISTNLTTFTNDVNFLGSIEIGDYTGNNGTLISSDKVDTRSGNNDSSIKPGRIIVTGDPELESGYNGEITAQFGATHSTLKSNGSIELVAATTRISMKNPSNVGVDITCDGTSTNGKATLNIAGHLTAAGDIHAARVYNAVYNDVAELYEKKDASEILNPGDVIVLDPDTGKYTKSQEEDSLLVVGVYSDSYGTLLGGTGFIEEDERNYIPVGISGRVRVKVIEGTGSDDLPKVKPGDLLSSAEYGYAKVSTSFTIGTIIGKALSESDEDGTVLMQIMLS